MYSLFILKDNIMKPITFISVYCILGAMHLKAQDSLKTQETTHPPVKIRIDFPGGQTIKAPLMAIRDSSLYIYEKSIAGKGHSQHVNIYDQSQWDGYQYKFIQSVKVYNKSLRAWLIPTTIVAGVLAGALIAKSTNHSPGGWESGYNAAGAVFLGGVLGGVVGLTTGMLIASSAEKKYMINGEWKNLAQLKADLKY
jgi:hypothetical protein